MTDTMKFCKNCKWATRVVDAWNRRNDRQATARYLGIPDDALDKVRELVEAIGGPEQGIPWMRNIIAKIGAVESLLAKVRT